jgi:hypothetical protein
MLKRESFRPVHHDQTTLLTASPCAWLVKHHQLYFLLYLVEEQDLSEILYPAQAKDPRGEEGSTRG